MKGGRQLGNDIVILQQIQVGCDQHGPQGDDDQNSVFMIQTAIARKTKVAV